MHRLACAAMIFVVLGGCQDAQTESRQDLSPAQPASSLEFLNNLDSAQTVHRADLLRGLLMARNGDAGNSFAANARDAGEAGLGVWKDPGGVVSVGEASTAAALAINGKSVSEADAMTGLASRGLIGTGRTPTDAIGGAELIALLDGVESMLKAGEKLPTGATTSAAAPTTAASGSASGAESFEAFGAPTASAPSPTPAAKPQPKAETIAETTPADVPTVRPEPLPEVRTVPATAAKKRAWVPSKPVPQGPR